MPCDHDSAPHLAGARATKFRFAAERIRKIVDSAPALTENQKRILAGILLEQHRENEDSDAA